MLAETVCETEVAIALLLLRGRLYEEQEELTAATKAHEWAAELAVEMNERAENLLAPESRLLLRRSLNPFVKTWSKIAGADHAAKKLRRQARSVLRQSLLPLVLQTDTTGTSPMGS